MPVKKFLRFVIPLFALMILLLLWSRSRSAAPGVSPASSMPASRQRASVNDEAESARTTGATSSSHRKEAENDEGSDNAITGIEEFTDADLVHEHVIHTLVPRGSSVVMAGERDPNGKRIFTILTPQEGGADMPQGQIKLSGRTYALDDQQIDESGMQTLLGNETRLHNQGEIWSAEDIKITQEKWPADAALSMPTVILGNGSEGMIEIGSLGKAPQLHRTKVHVQSSADGFELKTTLQTYKRQ